MTDIELPVPITYHPHWRVLFRPQSYERERIPRLADCMRIIGRNQVQLRGWDFPHISHRQEEKGTGTNWVASWSDFMGHLEYWRFHQSTQFLYLGSVRERTEPGWDEKLRQQAQSHFRRLGFDAANAPGFFHLHNFIYTVTEYFEFASRLCQAEVYEGSLELSIALRGTEGYVLTTGPDRVWYELHRSPSQDIGNTWTLSTTDLVTKAKDKSLEAIVWFFERFGWMELSPEVLKSEQESFLAGKL